MKSYYDSKCNYPREKLYYQCLLCGRTSELKSMKVIDVYGIRMFWCEYCENGTKHLSYNEN